MAPDTHKFDFFISSSGGLSIVNLVGAIASRDVPTLQNLFSKLEEQTGQCVVLSFRDVPSFSGEAIPCFADGLARVREVSQGIFICSVKPSIRPELESLVGVRGSEFRDNLAEAIQAARTLKVIHV
jgi:anti-anti-sigma regulatory factor